MIKQMQQPGRQQKSCGEQFRSPDDGRNSLGVNRMYGEEQRSHVGNLIAFRHLLEHLAKHEVEQQGDRRMKQQIYKMIAERVYVTYDPIQGEADESDRPKEVEGPGRLEEAPYRRRGDGRIVEDKEEIIVGETIE